MILPAQQNLAHSVMMGGRNQRIEELRAIGTLDP